jgi:short-subunit dehydrogenase
MNTVLVTGASGGIGEQLARVFAKNKCNLILVARSQAKLQSLADELKSQYGTNCTVISSDLSDPAAPAALFEQVKAAGLHVDILVNNAGLLYEGPLHANPLESHLQLLQVNVQACVALAYLFLKPMLEKRSGKILNVASTSAFQPVPMLSTYGASKAFLLSFSEALSIETQGTGVTVTALCPGFTNTDMIAKDNGGKSMNLPFVPNMEASEVAQEGYDACMAGKFMHINGRMNQLVVEVGRFQPRPLRRFLSGLIAKRGF